MTRRQWILHLIVLCSIWAADQFTKAIAVSFIHQPLEFGPFGLMPRQNPGAFLGIFSELPPFLRMICLSTGGAFLFLIYLSLQFLLSRAGPKIQIGMTILMAGILGNLTDRWESGAVTDYFLIRIGNWISVLNLADLAEVIGATLIVFSTPEWMKMKSFRSKIWINPSFQTRYIATLVLIGSAIMLVNFVFFSTFLRWTISSLLATNSPLIQNQYLYPFYATFAVIAGGFAVALILVGRVLSHRIAGPLFAFERFLFDLLAGKDSPMKLRAGDEFRHLEELSEELRKRFKCNSDR